MSASTRVVNQLRKTCLQIRRDIIEMIFAGGSGHLGGSLSCVEILTTLYFHALRVDPSNPGWQDRDRFILSKGHASSTLYAVLAEKGFFDREELLTFASPGTRLQKHVDMCIVPGAELSTGSLGQGLSVGVGMAIVDRMDKKDRRVFVLIGDGESQEGQIWEAAMYAGHLRLEKLIVFLDFNRCQVDGYVHEVCGIDPVDAKWRSFGWSVQTIDGHDINQIITALDNVHRSNEDRPQMIVCRTIKGKGISFMENQVNWHSRGLTDGEYQIAMDELAEAELLLE